MLELFLVIHIGGAPAPRGGTLFWKVRMDGLDCIAVGLLVLGALLIAAHVGTVRTLKERLERLELRIDGLIDERDRSSPATHAPDPAPKSLFPDPQLLSDSVEAVPLSPTVHPLTPASVSDHVEATCAAPTPQVAPPPAAVRKLEERLGARLPVWIGSIALLLSVAFLVKYTFDQGLITPPLRVAGGLLFGLGLMAFGWWVQTRSPSIASGVTGAGVGAVYASLLAGIQLYHLIGPTLGFVLMAANTAAAILLALRHGPFVAGLGMLGGFLTPALIGADEPRPGPLFGYLLLLEAGLLVAARARKWRPMMPLTLLGGCIWAAMWLAAPFSAADALWIGSFLVLSLAALLAALPTRRNPVEMQVYAHAGVLLAGGLLVLLVRRSDFSPIELGMLALTAGGTLILARVRRVFAFLPWTSLALVLVMLLAWMAQRSLPEARFGLAALAFGGLYVGGAWLLMWRCGAPAQWAVLSVVAGLAHLLLAYFGLSAPPPGVAWGWICLGLAAAYAGIARLHWARHDDRSQGTWTIAALATGTTVFLSLAVPIELKREWLAVAWALEVPALILLAQRLRVPILRDLAACLTVLVVAQLINPGVIDYPLGQVPILNWILYGYGVPAAALGVAAWLLRRSGEASRLGAGLEACSALLTFALATLEIRHLFHGHLRFEDPLLRESATYVLAWLGLGLIWHEASRRTSRPLQRPVALLHVGLAWLATILALLLVRNPLLQHESVGGLGQWLVYCYLAPAVALSLIARRLTGAVAIELVRALGVTSLVLVFAWLSLTVRCVFRGEFLDAGPVTSAESHSYSIAWMVLGAALLALGIATRSFTLRWASLVVVFLAVGKVFLIDMGQLRDLYRVASFFGLGVTLLGLAYVYQRFVFPKSAQPSGAAIVDS